MQIVYSTETVANLEGREFRNPRHFLAPVSGATKVYIAGHWPNVAAAYEKAGVPVAPIADMRALPGHAKTVAKAGESEKAKPATGAEPNPIG